MNTTLTPTNLSELVEAVRATPRLLAVGAGTKPRLSAVHCPKLSTTKLTGIIEYEPSEFTFTALAGTPVRAIAAALAKCGQYLPFDPLLVDAGGTLGGAVAAGLSGPGRFRFGGIRDFILGIQFVDGAGRLLRMGGKVVKNAAGFDLPKFFVGSLGRFGVLTEMTFKVFPAPAARLTPQPEPDNVPTAVKILTAARNSRWEQEALDRNLGERSVALRLSGPASALDLLAGEVLSRWPGRILAGPEAETFWENLRELRWADHGCALIKIALAPGHLPNFHQVMENLGAARCHISAGGNVAYISLTDPTQFATLDSLLQQRGWSGLTLRGDGPLWLGSRPQPQIATAVKAALDSENRFPSLHD